MLADCDWVEVEGMEKDFLDLMSKSHEYFKRLSIFCTWLYLLRVCRQLTSANLSRQMEILSWNELRFLFRV